MTDRRKKRMRDKKSTNAFFVSEGIKKWKRNKIK
jgi:hypothetical protein